MSQRRSGIKVKQAAKPPYTVDEEVIRRYDQKNLIFNRDALDPTWCGHLRSEEEAGLMHMESAEPGYTRTDYALGEASWTLHEGYTDAFGRNRIKRPLGPSLMGIKWYSKKYEVDDPIEMSMIVKRAAKFYGASLVGITKYKPIWMQANRRYDLAPLEMPEEINRVVVCGVEMDELGISLVTRHLSLSHVMGGFQQPVRELPSSLRL